MRRWNQTISTVSQLVTAFTEGGGECTRNTLSLSPAMAKRFGIVNNTRYTLIYNSITRVLCLRRKPVTILNVPPGSSSQRRIGTIGIGDVLVAQFGLNLKPGALITVVHGRIRLRLRYVEVRDPDFFSYVFNLNQQID